jgi:hypothetical protein
MSKLDLKMIITLAENKKLITGEEYCIVKCAEDCMDIKLESKVTKEDKVIYSTKNKK